MSNTLRHFSRSTVFTLRAPAWIACLALLGACGGSSSNGGITAPLAPPHSVAATTPIAISGKNLAYCADEATTGPTGTNFNIANGDTDKIDSIAVAVDMDTNVVTVLNVAVPISTVTRPLAWIGNELYIVADEAADSHDWNGDTVLDDLVLLHWSAAMPTLMYIDTLSTVGPIKMVAIGTNLFYSSATVPSGAMASNLEVISSAMPLLKTPIPTTDLLGALSPRILGQDEGLIFLSLDEVVEARDLNGDSDPTDNFVLALLDGTDALGVIRNTGLAVADASSPFRARRTSTSSHDWQVGFLVNETAQGATNLNDPALFSASWLPVQCIGHEDGDTIDDVLHFLTFASWNTNPVTSPPRNTGLVGSQKIVIANGFIGTISPEASEGTCILNGDTDTTDNVFRWTQIVANTLPILPLNTPANIHALFDVPGGTHGVAELGNLFVIEVSENADNLDINGDTLKTFNLIGWLSPSTTAQAWDFTHGSANNTFVGASWMAEQRDRAQLDVAFEERVGGVSINNVPPSNPGDSDTLDSVPTFASFGGSPAHMVFPGVAIAVQANNAGILVARGTGFYRVDEAADNRDWNGDTDKSDFVLWRTSLSQGTSAFMATLNSLNRPAIEFNVDEQPFGAAFLTDETMQGAGGTDINGDGTKHLIVQYFKF